VTHIFEQLEDYGPVYGFWTFLFERLNKVLKSYSTNNHGDGEIEVSFFRAFTRDTELRTMVISFLFLFMNTRILNCDVQKMTNLLARNAGSNKPPSAEDSFLFDAVRAILTTDSDTRGTVASLASEIDDIAQQGACSLALSSYPDIVL
jgi:hypothetical protein